jgi:predicted enzyme related to lactoylglutathione lyase
VDAARVFYTELLNLSFGDEGPSHLEVWPLHEQARARGAPAHWLGHIGVADLDAMIQRLVELGSERLGPTVHTSKGTAFAALRDPGGAVVGVRAGTEQVQSAPVVWHQLHTRDLDASWAVYSALFGWAQTGTAQVEDPVGGHRMFAWDASGEIVGSMANTARWAGVHTHWLFYFPVTDINASLAKVRARGGKALAPVQLPNGDWLAPCDDPQGAAFGVLQART